MNQLKQPETVSSYQMSALFLAYMSGSTIIYIPAPLILTTSNGAWISIIIGTMVGIIL